MAENEQEAPVEAEDTEEEISTEETETTDWQAEAKKARAIAQRLRTKLTKATEKKVEAPKEEKKQGLDRLDKAILRVEKITAQDEVELVESIMKETGKDVEGVLASKYFQNELKALREEATRQDATPSNSKRSGQAPRDTVEYWLAKGPGPEGLPKDNPALAREVVAARMKQIKNAKMFSDDPIIS